MLSNELSRRDALKLSLGALSVGGGCLFSNALAPVTALADVSLPSGSTVYPDSPVIYYSTNGTVIRHDDNNRSVFCVDPLRPGVNDKTGPIYYNAGALSDLGEGAKLYPEAVRCLAWYCYGSEGFDESLWQKYGIGFGARNIKALDTPEKYYFAMSHILMSDITAMDGVHATGGMNKDDAEWVAWNIIGYSLDDSTENPNSLRVAICVYNRDNLATKVPPPSQFQVYALNTNRGDGKQAYIGTVYVPKAKARLHKTPL